MDLSDELIDGILQGFPAHKPGTRPVHSFGISATGRFQPNDVVSGFTSAAPLNEEGPVTVRFSNGTGDEGVPDNRRDARGMAVRFGDPSKPGFDMICMTLPVFFVRTVDAFRDFTAAAVPPDPPQPRPWWQNLVDLVSLRNPPVDPSPSDPGILAFSARHPDSCPAMAAFQGQSVPASYAARSYHAVHAFRLTAADGSTRWVRFRWEPSTGVRVTTTRAEHFLQGELRERVAAEAVEFVLRAQIADQGDDTSDTTRPWPQSRRRVVLGHLRLDAIEDDADGEARGFNVHNLPPGIDGDPDDEIFAVRGDAYRASQARRHELARRS